ncbi:hypothetical protein [Rickettsia endosymbiont of Gonocerus acuteangulatus]|uniref:hypothetical protein n=1 Tax=Rickettsia endosymbiont of Gonocerus acuteangulatus TaxID=3066266 RepID=UPI003132CA86
MALAKGLKNTQITHLHLYATFRSYKKDQRIQIFVQGLKGSKVIDLDLSSNDVDDIEVHTLGESLKDSKIIDLNLGGNSIKDKGAEILANCLKDTQIAYLNLSYNNIGSEGIRTLAACLKDTQIIHLVLNEKSIGKDGAQALATGLKNTQVINLILTSQHLGKDGMNSMIKDFQDSHIACLDINFEYIGLNTYWELRNVLYHNWINAKHLTHIFKNVVFEDNNNLLAFSTIINDLSLEQYTDQCIFFINSINCTPGMVSHIINDNSITYTREQIVKFIKSISDEFAVFNTKLEADINTKINILKKCEDMELSSTVESLLYHRPIYLIDEKQCILHPYMYKMLNKYDIPLYNEQIEPNIKEKIISYYANHPEVDDAQDIIDLLGEVEIT